MNKVFNLEISVIGRNFLVCGSLIDVPEANRGWILVKDEKKSPEIVNSKILAQTFGTELPGAP